MSRAASGFPVFLTPPDLSPWRNGNTGVPGFTSYAALQPGPHVALIALVHGNELAGAIVLDKLLRAGLRPKRGRISFGFANLAAMDRFDPAHPTASRSIDEDLNRVWDRAMLDGPARSAELRRAREIRPFLDNVDILLDLHSMLWPSDPLTLCGMTRKGRDLATRIGAPGLAVADPGHANGTRMIQYGAFADPDHEAAAVLVEAGQHWRMETVESTLQCVAALLRSTGQVDDHPILPPTVSRPPPRFAEVTHVVTAATNRFSFLHEVRGGEVIPHRNTLLAMDGASEIRTPYDDCLLVMPSLSPSQGHTAVRLARFESSTSERTKP